MGGGRHKHSTPKQGVWHAPAQHQPRPGKRHRQPTPDNARRTAAEKTAHQQNKPSIEPATTPRTETQTYQHSTPHEGGGHAQTRHAPTGGGARTSTARTTARQTTQPRPQPIRRQQPMPITTTPRTTTAADGHQHSTPHHEAGDAPHSMPNLEGVHKPTQHTPLLGGPHRNTARPTMGVGTHQHSTPDQEESRAPAHTQTRPGDQHNHNRNPTADHSHPNTPTIRRRREHQKYETSRAWRRLKHHHEHHRPGPNDPGRQAAHTTTVQAKHHLTMHNHPGGQAATKYSQTTQTQQQPNRRPKPP